ncbi:MAG: ribonuclease P protein component [Nitrospirae bacterium]|nr:ribonuclease P protein component [Nitrospirota bacterium]
MSKKSFRSLTKRRDFELVFKEGINSAAKHLVIYVKKNELNYNRLGLSVSKKVGKAVTRNRIKRLLREAIRKVSEEIPLYYDFVVVARRSSSEAELDDFIRDMKKSLEKIIDNGKDNEKYPYSFN